MDAYNSTNLESFYINSRVMLVQEYALCTELAPSVLNEQGKGANGNVILILYFLKIPFNTDVNVKTGFPDVNPVKIFTL